MNIVVAMKQIPDLLQMRIKNREPVLSGVPVTFGKIDKNALEAAVQLKEANGGEVIVVAVGSEELEDTVKEAMAAGADRSVLVADAETAELDSAAIAAILAQAIQKIEDVGLVVFAEGSGDNYSGQVGSRVAELLNLPQVGSVCEINLSGNNARLTRSLEDRLQVIEVQLPAVVIVAADLNEPRIPSVTQVLKAGKKPKEVFELDDFDFSGKKTITTLSNLAPEVNRKNIKLKSVGELVEALKNKGFIRG